ncbi:MAG: N-acetylmuramoyl-L-alanine amidase [Bacteroidetes bacterium]|nr:N-acetylmuramoyl-L-alanine amidase [Bacteroidota bacterium]
MFAISYIYSLFTGYIRFSGVLIVLILNLFPVLAQPEPKTGINCIVIDPGHGGIDPGAPGSKYNEKDIVLAIALKLGAYIKENMPDVKVVFTRETDIFIPLNERAEIANKNQADVFISIHCNANKSKTPFGTETYTMGLTKAADNLEVAKKENSVIEFEENFTSKYQGFDNSPESYIMLSLMQNTYRDQSIRLASFIQSQFKERANRVDRGVKQAGFVVLWQTAMPSVLVETGFLSNPEEEKFLGSKQGQDYIASSIYRAFRDYKMNIESHSVFGHKTVPEKIDTQIRISEPDKKVPELTDSVVVQSGYFMVQISSSTKPIPLNSKLFKGVKDITEFKADQRYKYTVGQKTDFKEILAYLRNIRQTFPDAFVVGCIDGKIVPAKEVLNQIKALN